MRLWRHSIRPYKLCKRLGFAGTFSYLRFLSRWNQIHNCKHISLQTSNILMQKQWRLNQFSKLAVDVTKNGQTFHWIAHTWHKSTLRQQLSVMLDCATGALNEIKMKTQSIIYLVRWQHFPKKTVCAVAAVEWLLRVTPSYTNADSLFSLKTVILPWWYDLKKRLVGVYLLCSSKDLVMKFQWPHLNASFISH